MRKIHVLMLVYVALVATSCVKDVIYGPCTIANVSNSVAYTASDTVRVTAKITSLAGVESAKIVYNVNDAASAEVPMVVSGDVYEGAIPPQPLDATVNYSIVAKSINGDITTSVTKTYKVGAVVINYSGLVLNELNGNDKFIELYNRGSADIPLVGVQIFKDGAEISIWTSDSRLIKPGEYLLLYSQDVTGAGGAQAGYNPALVFTSGLSAKKAVRIELKDPSGNKLDDFNLVTCVTPAAASYTRVPDGTGGWFHTAATPGAANSTDNSTPVAGLEGWVPPMGNITDIVINELNGNDKFIELYNKGTLPVNIAGCYIRKDESTAAIWTAVDTSLAAGAYMLLYSENVTATGQAQEGYNPALVFIGGLSAKKTVAIQLFAPDNSQIDLFLRGGTLGGSWGASAANVAGSFARCPNATGDFKVAAPTPGAVNPETGDAIP